MTSGPATRLLAAFCAMAGEWFRDEPRKVDCAPHGGRFDATELGRFRLAAPAVRASCLAVASASADGDGSVLLDYRVAAVAIARGGRGEKRGEQARRLADRVAFELAREQKGEGGLRLWPQAAFSATELAPAVAGGPRWGDIGEPREIRAANLYSAQLDGKGVALWAVTWLQQFRARPEDFALPGIEEGAIPETVKSGFAPDIGTGHEGDYGQVAPEEGA